MSYKVPWHILAAFEAGDGRVVWVWDRKNVQLAVGFQAWNRISDSIVFMLVDTGNTVRTEIHGVILWADVVSPNSP